MERVHRVKNQSNGHREGLGWSQGGWARRLGAFRIFPCPLPLDRLTMMWGLMLLAAFLIVGKRQMLAMWRGFCPEFAG